MHRMISASIETAVAAVSLVPIFLYLHKSKFHSVRTSVTALTFSLYLCAVYALVGLPNVLYIRFDPNYNFVPFRYMFTDATTVLNVLLFIPLGFFLPVLRSKFRTLRSTLLFGFLMSAFIELLQLFTYRATDVNDLMTNTAGTILGYFLGKSLLKLFPSMVLEEDPREMRTICLIVLGVMFFIHPFLSGIVQNLIY